MVSLITSSIRQVILITTNILDFSRSNIPFFVSPPIAFVAAQYLYGHRSIIELFKPFVLSFLYAYFFLMQLNIGNDLNGVESDRIDKPSRPIPSNRISIERARHLYYLMVFVFAAYSYLIDHLFMCIGGIFLGIIANFTSMHKFSIQKNGILVPAVYAMISVIWCIMNDVSDVLDRPKVLWNLIFTSCIIGVIMIQQDMRDIEGDRALGRQTFSVVIGSPKAEQLIAKICFGALLCLLLDASLIGQERSVSKATYMIVSSLLYGIMIVRNWYSFDLRKTYEVYFHLTFFWHLFALPIVNDNSTLAL